MMIKILQNKAFHKVIMVFSYVAPIAVHKKAHQYGEKQNVLLAKTHHIMIQYDNL